MINAKAYQGFHDDKKVEEHWHRYNCFSTKQWHSNWFIMEK